jgi:hypothetical protein
MKIKQTKSDNYKLILSKRELLLLQEILNNSDVTLDEGFDLCIINNELCPNEKYENVMLAEEKSTRMWKQIKNITSI